MKTFFLIITLFLIIKPDIDVDNYIKQNELVLIKSFEDFIGDKFINDIWITTDNLEDYTNYNNEAGFFQAPDYITIDNNHKYLAYELKDFKSKNKYKENSNFVKAVVMHELCHAYFYQIMMIAKQKEIIHKDYLNDTYGSKFIEEGVCEYLVVMMNEMISTDVKTDVKTNFNDMESYDVMYRYSREFVKPIINTYGFKNAILLIISHKSPEINEIKNPEQYYNRLKKLQF